MIFESWYATHTQYFKYIAISSEVFVSPLYWHNMRIRFQDMRHNLMCCFRLSKIDHKDVDVMPIAC